MKFNSRTIHRDFAYFYVGLIIAFSFSGIILNHRQDWYPMDYTYESSEVSTQLPEDLSKFEDKSFIKELALQIAPENTFDSHRIRNNQLMIVYKGNTFATINLEDGKGLVETKRKVPVLGHTMFLHKTTNKAWIWYSDIFGVAMLTIAVTGMLIPAGKNGFSKRGWKLAIAGMLFPLLFLIFLA